MEVAEIKKSRCQGRSALEHLSATRALLGRRRLMHMTLTKLKFSGKYHLVSEFLKLKYSLHHLTWKHFKPGRIRGKAEGMGKSQQLRDRRHFVALGKGVWRAPFVLRSRFPKKQLLAGKPRIKPLKARVYWTWRFIC